MDWQELNCTGHASEHVGIAFAKVWGQDLGMLAEVQ
jgi:hypothetical protein